MKIWVETREGRERAWASRRVAAPRNFCLETNYEECARCLTALRESLTGSLKEYHKVPGARRPERRHIPSFLDFATIERCTPSAALALAAEYDRARSLVPWNIRLINLHNWRRDLIELLDEIGFFDLLDIDRPKVGGNKRSAVTVVKFETGNTFGNTEASALTRRVAEMIVQADPDGLLDEVVTQARLRLYSALVEACENTRRHAYHEGEGYPPEIRRWWMTGAVHQVEKRLTLVVYDQGATIPFRLPGWEGFALVQRALALVGLAAPMQGSTALDGIMLRIAMTVPRSSTREPHRGQGFPAFLQVVKGCERGRLRVVSRSGEFTYEKGKPARGRQLPVPLAGTLVEWDLWL